jgi:pimeloyl-ACP methyl ester carboxylesterase
MDVSNFTAHRRALITPAGQIAYSEFGDGPAAVFVHGLATSGLLWRHVIEQLSDTSRCIAIDLPAHGGTSPREDLSVGAIADVLEELCDGLRLGQVDLVANDTGGAISQIFAARYPQRLRSFTLTNCDTDGNFPPQEFAPIVDLARQGQLAPILVDIANDPASWRSSPLAGLYSDPAAIPDEVWREYYAVGETGERARDVERMIAAFDPADLAAASGGLRTLQVPTLIVWGTAKENNFDVKWAYQLRDMIPGARDVVEVDGAKLLFPEERPGDLVPHLRSLWDR